MVTGTNQSVGAVSGAGTTDAENATVYSGDTIVGDGTNAAGLTATQILQNTLTINAGSTVTIVPSGIGIQSDTAIAAGSTVGATATSAASDDSESDPLLAIQAAIASGSISEAAGQRLENRIVAIERLAATDPSLDESLLESRVLAAVSLSNPPSSLVLPYTDSSPVEIGSDLLSVDSREFTSASNGETAFAPTAGIDASPTTVPEPSTFVLAVSSAIVLVRAARRRKSQGTNSLSFPSLSSKVARRLGSGCEC